MKANFSAHALLSSIDTVALISLLIAGLCVWWNKKSPGDHRDIRLLSRFFGGFTVFLLGLNVILPKLASPQKTFQGVVTGFHQVSEYRSSHFEFRINRQGPSLSAYYFDRGFYFGDPSVSDGDTIEVTYLSWTNQVLRLREIAGHHVGWTFEEDSRPLGPWLLLSAGVLLILGAIWGKLSDIAARPDSRADLPGSGLG